VFLHQLSKELNDILTIYNLIHQVMLQSAKLASSKNVLWLTKHELLEYVKEKVLHICNCTLVIFIFSV